MQLQVKVQGQALKSECSWVCEDENIVQYVQSVALWIYCKQWMFFHSFPECYFPLAESVPDLDLGQRFVSSAAAFIVVEEHSFLWKWLTISI